MSTCFFVVVAAAVGFALFVKQLFDGNADLESANRILRSAQLNLFCIQYTVHTHYIKSVCKSKTIGKMEMNSATIGIDMALLKNILENIVKKGKHTA